MPVVQNLYQIFKLPATMVVENDCNIEKYDRQRGIKEGNVVSIGDNIVFQQLRYLHNDFSDHHEIYNKIQKLRKSAHKCKKEGNYSAARALESYISRLLFVEDIVNVVVDGKKSDFNKFRSDGFNLNGSHYVYLCSGSGQIRRNTATFVKEEYRDILVKNINCGLDEKTSQFVLAKYSAYFALSFSSILWVRTPRVCVIKDFFNTLKKEPVDFIYHDENGEAQIEERIMDLEINCADGQGLIDPYFAQKWAEDMDLPYIPCSFVARSCFVKGNLATFDFKEYAHKHNILKIRDKWGKEYNIDDIDVLLSESQFKTSKYYSSWEDYMSYVEKANIHWGVARYNRQVDPENILANYQYIQSLSLSTEDIQQLIDPTVKWIDKICSGDPLYTMLYLFGQKNDYITYDDVYSAAQTTAIKALVMNQDFLNDSYIQNKVYKLITQSINHSKLGKIWVHGNYQFMVSDPVAQCQAALGLPVTGLVQKDQVWSKFWTDRGATKVDLCRSPMIDVHEHNPCDIHYSDDASYWYRYINSGIIFSIYDTGTFRAEDADFDGDIVLSTDNEFFIKGAHKDHNIITYEKGLAKPAKMTVPNITKTVMKGFGTGVGGFSNTATIMYAMAAIFDRPGHEDQHAELMRRIKLLREIVGQEIDRIKGADKPSLPSSWKKYEQILETDTPEEKTRKMRQNAMVISKKPYFFRYLYPELNQRFKAFEKSYDDISRDMFGIKFKKLLKKDDKAKTPEEKDLIRRYQKYCPLITAPCTMNKLCREFESIDFDIQFSKGPNDTKKKAVSKLPTFENYYKDTFSQDKFDKIRKLYQTYSTGRKIKTVDHILQATSTIQEDVEDGTHSLAYHEMLEDYRKIYREEIQPLLYTQEEFLFYCYRLSKTYTNFNWAFPWDILGESIVKSIPHGKSYCPVIDPQGDHEYLGITYSFKDLTQVSDVAIQRIIYEIFGDPESRSAEGQEGIHMPDIDALNDAMLSAAVEEAIKEEESK